MKKNKYHVTIIALILMILFLLQISASADDIFTTGGTVEPEKDIYYVGDTVSISDYFRNKSTISATSVYVEYYYRLDGANSVYSGNKISMGTIAGGSTETHSFEYTFKESDIGQYRIGAKITYTMSGTTASEYSTGHDFNILPEPTPSPTPVTTPAESVSPSATVTPASPSPSPTPTSEPTPEPTEDSALAVETTEIPTPIPTFTPKPEETKPSETVEKTRSTITLKSLLRNKAVVTVLAIILSAILSLLIIIIIVALKKKR